MDKFNSKVSISGSGCWNWAGFKNRNGYGVFGRQLAHRAAWTQTQGVIPSGLLVLHRCDNPSCVNTQHLFLGTQADNMRDMISKGRDRKATPERHGTKLHPESIARGEKRGASKLKTADIHLIRILIASGLPHRKIAKQFGVSSPQISYIKNRKTWSHV